MGRKRSKYQRENEEYKNVIDETAQKKIKLDADLLDNTKYDSVNALVLPSEKRQTKKIRSKTAPPVKILSKKQRKKLEKIVEAKQQKEQRSGILAKLEKLHADPKALASLVPYEVTQTLGRKKYLSDAYNTCDISNVKGKEVSAPKHISVIKGKLKNSISPKKIKNPNVVELKGLSSSSESEDESEEEEEKGNMEETINENNNMPVENASFKEESIEITSDNVSINDSKIYSNLIENISSTDTKIDKTGTKTIARQSKFNMLDRSEEVQKARLKLPILSEEQVIMESINDNLITIVYGPTGSGKTTQVPQFLYEAGYTSDGKIIGVTEPRRVAAISMSQRVAHEMNLTSKEISYQIRFEGNVTPDTKIKFMTDGVLLKEMQKDPSLRKYSAIIIDEAHERSVHSDILIGFLTRIVVKRNAKNKPLKLIIMSATLRIEDFTNNKRLLKDVIPPVVKVDSRMFEVTKHFSKRTLENYLETAYKKVCKIHRSLPEGGILVFLTGQQEIHTLIRWLAKTFPQHKDGSEDNDESHMISNYRKKKIEAKVQLKILKKGGKPADSNNEDTTTNKTDIVLSKISLEDFNMSLPENDEEEICNEDDKPLKEPSDDFIDSSDEDDDDDGTIKPSFLKPMEKEQPLHLLPLYSMLPPHKQKLVFQPPPDGTRLCIVATNVAETSLTIPNIKYVVDCGKVKEKVYDKVTGISTFHVKWISQASAEQRAGRAGRTAPGHAYRLYSSAVYEDFEKFSKPEICRRPIDDVVLLMKSMSLPVINFPFPTPPEKVQIKHALRTLVTLGALEKSNTLVVKKNKDLLKDETKISELGKLMAAYPVSPRFAKMLALSSQQGLLPYTVCLVAALSVPEVLREAPLDQSEDAENLRKKWSKRRAAWAGSGHYKLLGDPAILLRAIGEAEYLGGGKQYCEKHGLRPKGVVEIRKLRRQLTNEINATCTTDLILDPKMPPPTDDQARLLRQILLLGLVDRIAKRVDEFEVKDPADRPKWRNAYRSIEIEEPVFLSTSSVLCDEKPTWVVYQEIYESNKLFMRGITVIEPEWLVNLAPQMCTFSPPLESPSPRYDSERDRILCHRTAKFGPESWELPEAEVEYPHSSDLFRWFAYFLLKGEVCPVLKKYAKDVDDPRTLINPVAIRFREQRKILLYTLRSQDAYSFERLKTIWDQQPKFLLAEYIQWIKDDNIKYEVRSNWPPLIKDESTTWD